MAFLPQDEGGGGGGDMGGGMGGGGGRGGGGGGMGGGGGAVNLVDVYVRWITALPIKEAIAVRRYGKEAGTSPDAAKSLAREETFYAAQLEGVPGRFTVDDIKNGSVLNVKGLPPIQPVQVQTAAGRGTGRGPAPADYFVVFPKAQAGGHVFKVEDVEVEFAINVPNLKFKKKFKLKDMVFNGKLEM